MRVRSKVIAIGLTLAATLPAAAECTLLKASDKSEAELRVYFTKFEKEDATNGRYKNCRVVEKKVEGTKVFWITPFRQDANVVVHPSNWPR